MCMLPGFYYNTPDEWNIQRTMLVPCCDVVEALAASDPLRVGSPAKRVHRGMWPRPLVAPRSPQSDETSAVRDRCVVTLDTSHRSESLLVTMLALAQLGGWHRPDKLHGRPALAPCPRPTSGRLTLAAPLACFAASSSTTLQREASAILGFPIPT